MTAQGSRQGYANLWGQSIARYCRHKEIGVAYRAGSPYIRAIPSSRVLTFAVALADPADLKAFLGLSEQLALFLGVPQCRMQRHLGRVMIEVPLPKGLWANVDANRLEGGEGMRVALGITTLQTPVFITVDADSIAPILLAGRTGSGKTEAMRTIMWRLALQNASDKLKFVIYDPKRKFQALQRLSHLQLPLLRSPGDGIVGIAWLTQELHKRASGDSPTSPQIVCFIDELIDLMQHNEDGTKEYLGTLARMGRELGIMLVVGTQRPSRKYMDTLTAANVGLRLVGKVPDTSEATVATGIGGSGAHLLLGGGDMLAIGNEVHRLQIGIVSMRHFASLPQTEEPPSMPEAPGGVSPLMTRLGAPAFTVEQYATALTDKGIMALKDALNVGQPKATRLRKWAQPILARLHEIGYNVEEAKDVPKNNSREPKNNSCEAGTDDSN